MGDDPNIAKLAKHTIGYQTREYLQNLLLEDATEFEFYQGFIRQKGTKIPIDTLLRNKSIIPTGSTFEYYEEWLIRRSVYGATSLENEMEFLIPRSKITRDQQWIRFFNPSASDQKSDPIFDIVPNDPLLINPPEIYTNNLFKKKIK